MDVKESLYMYVFLTPLKSKVVFKLSQKQIMKVYVKLMIWIVSFKYNIAFGLSWFGKIAQTQWNDPLS